jgi:hypothetical protein
MLSLCDGVGGWGELDVDWQEWKKKKEFASRVTQASDTPPGSDMRKSDSYACGVII